MLKTIGLLHIRNISLQTKHQITKPCQLYRNQSLIPKQTVNLLSTFTSLNQSTNSSNISKQNDVYSVDHLIDPNSGAIDEVPRSVKYGNLKMFVVFTIFTLLGAKMANVCTTYLEANDIFSPSDDDDDDQDDDY